MESANLDKCGSRSAAGKRDLCQPKRPSVRPSTVSRRDQRLERRASLGMNELSQKPSRAMLGAPKAMAFPANPAAGNYREILHC